jgi:ribosomal protein L16/L10AE
MAQEAMRLAGYKLPVKTRFLVRDSDPIFEQGA